MSEVVVKKTTYIGIWAALIVLTVVTALVSLVDLGMWSGPVALLIASCKALLVAMFFMHLRYENYKMVWIIAVAGIFWLSLLMVLSMTDYATRGFINVPGK